MLKIDIHTHILPKDLPKWKDKFGYGGFIQLDHHKPCCARMMKDDGTFFREIDSNCWSPTTRVKECDEQGVHVQVLSTVPVLFGYWTKPEHGHDISRFLNDHLSQCVQAHPKRFAGLGTVPLQDTSLAIKELERCVKQLGLRGVEIGSHVNGKNLNDPELFDFFQAAQDLDAAIFVHPWDMLGKERMEKYWLPWLAGMPVEMAIAISSMIFGGVFERLPKLRVAFAHGGGAFPGTLGRFEHGFNVRPDLVAVDNNKGPREYLNRIYVDTLVHDPNAMQLLLNTFGAKQMALGSDYPFPLGEHQPGQLIESMNLSNEITERLLAGTALEWLNMDKREFL